MDKRFKYLDLVRVESAPIVHPDGVHILRTADADENLAFWNNAVGRVVSRSANGFQVFFPVPGFPNKGALVDLASRNLMLVRAATQEDFLVAHYESAEIPVKRPVTPPPVDEGIPVTDGHA